MFNCIKNCVLFDTKQTNDQPWSFVEQTQQKFRRFESVLKKKRVTVVNKSAD